MISSWGETTWVEGDLGRNNLFPKPVAGHCNLPNRSSQHITVCGLSLHQGSTEGRKTLQQKFIFQIGILKPHGINRRFSPN